MSAPHTSIGMRTARGILVIVASVLALAALTLPARGDPNTPGHQVQGSPIAVLYHPGAFTEPEPQSAQTVSLTTYTGARLVDAQRPASYKADSPVCEVRGDVAKIKGTEDPCPAMLPESGWPDQLLPVPGRPGDHRLYTSIIRDRTDFYQAQSTLKEWNYDLITADNCSGTTFTGSDDVARQSHTDWRWSRLAEDPKCGQQHSWWKWKADFSRVEWYTGTWVGYSWTPPCDDPRKSEGVFASGGILADEREEYVRRYDAFGDVCRQLTVEDNDSRATPYVQERPKLNAGRDKNAAAAAWEQDKRRIEAHNVRTRNKIASLQRTTSGDFNELHAEWRYRGLQHSLLLSDFEVAKSDEILAGNMFVVCQLDGSCALWMNGQEVR